MKKEIGQLVQAGVGKIGGVEGDYLNSMGLCICLLVTGMYSFVIKKNGKNLKYFSLYPNRDPIKKHRWGQEVGVSSCKLLCIE